MCGKGRRLDLTGIYPPIATPFNPDESIAWDKLAQNMAKWVQQPIRGFLVQVSFFLLLLFEHDVIIKKDGVV